MMAILLSTKMLGHFKRVKNTFYLFVSTREVGQRGYMSWEEIKKIAKYDFVEIGNHSHSHDYLIDFDDEKIKDDLKKSIDIFKKNLKKIQIFFLIRLGNIVLI